MMNLKPVLLALPLAFACYAPNSLAQDVPFFQNGSNADPIYDLNVITGNGDINLSKFEVFGSYTSKTACAAMTVDPLLEVDSTCTAGYCYTVSNKHYYLSSNTILGAFGPGIKCLKLRYNSSDSLSATFQLTYSGGAFTASPSSGTVNFTGT